MEATCSSETSMVFHRTAHSYGPEDYPTYFEKINEACDITSLSPYPPVSVYLPVIF
jgi:hypothetical protein